MLDEMNKKHRSIQDEMLVFDYYYNSLSKYFILILFSFFLIQHKTSCRSKQISSKTPCIRTIKEGIGFES